jgi:hypothetical protein
VALPGINNLRAVNIVISSTPARLHSPGLCSIFLLADYESIEPPIILAEVATREWQSENHFSHLPAMRLPFPSAMPFRMR